jgi:hypothetical protein
MKAGGTWAPLGRERDFRWRGGSLSRIEVFVDVALVLAVGVAAGPLTVVPNFGTGGALVARSIAFAAGFTAIAACWYEHHRFHRRYGLDDLDVTVLGLALAGVVLASAASLGQALSLLAGAVDVYLAPGDRSGQAGRVAAVCSVGFAGVSAVFAALYRRAWRVQWQLDLDSVERVLTKARVHGHAADAAIGAAAAGVAAFSPRWSLAVYAALVPLHLAHARITARTVARFRGRVPGVHRSPG